MTTDPHRTAALAWPADPASAWAEASRAPAPLARRGLPPAIDSFDDIAAGIRRQPTLLPTFSFALGGVGALLLLGLAAGILPLSGRTGAPVVVQWAAGVCLLVAGIALGIAHRRRIERDRRSPRPPAQGVLCEMHPSALRIYDGDGYGDTALAIEEATPDAQAARIATAFSIWIARLEADQAADRETRAVWQSGNGKGIANVYASEEFFGADARGGYVVRANPHRPRWALLLAVVPAAPQAHPLRHAHVLAADDGDAAG